MCWVAVCLDGLDILICEAGLPADGGQQRAERDAALGPDGFLQDVMEFRLGISAVLGRSHAQRAMDFLGEVPYGESGHRNTSFA
jgi:hypothetical protein